MEKDQTMTSRAFARVGGASLIVLSTMVACSGAKMGHRPAIAAEQASDVSNGIERSLTSHDYARALLEAERLVEASPRDPAARTLLGRAYLANGRYSSARAAFEDAMTLGVSDSRTVISLALIRTAMGSAEGARALLSAHIDQLPASDYGLAMAMAGDPNEGVRALLEAVRAPEADAQTRQNLAYALALNGQWGQARLVAGQDLAGSQLQQRMALWATSADAGAYPQRIASFLGVQQRADDSGLPERLALSNSAPTSMAAAQPLEPAALAAEAVENAPTQTVGIANAEEAFVPPSEPAPIIRASADPMREAVMQRIAAPVVAPKDKAAPLFTRSNPLSRTASVPLHGGSDWVVQIGAFNDGQMAASAWARAKGRDFETRGYRKITGTVKLAGRVYHRLAMSGFANRNEAANLCTALRSSGQSCFVRRDEAVASEIRTAGAGKKPAEIASR